MDRVSHPPTREALSFPMAVRRLARDAHRVLDPASSASLAELDCVLDQAALLGGQINRAAQSDLARWLELLTQQVEDRREDALSTHDHRRAPAAGLARF